MGLGVILLAISQISLSQKIAQADEEARPANLDVTMIMPIECQTCFDPQHILTAIARQPVTITDENIIAYPSEQASNLIAKHGLSILPAVIISGETEKENVKDFFSPQTRKSKDDLVWTQIPPPYIDLESSEIKGSVSLTLLNKESCEECYDVNKHASILAQNFGMTIQNVESVDSTSAKGRELIKTYNLTALPTAIVSSDAAAYAIFTNAWNTVGSTEEDGSYIFRNLNVMGPYFDLETQTVVIPNTK